MARYGWDYDQPRREGPYRPGGAGGYGRRSQYGAGDYDYRYGVGPEDFRGGRVERGYGAEEVYPGAYGGMRSDAYGPAWDSGDWRRGLSEFGPGGGAYDTAYRSNRSFRGYDRDFTRQRYRGEEWRPRTRDSERVRVSEIMTAEPEAVTPDTKVSEVAKKMRDLDVGIIPVVEDEDTRRLKGVVTDRDLAVRVLAEGKDGKMKVADCLTADVETVNRNDSVNRILDVMKREQVRRVPVTDGEGRLVGIVSQADMAVDYAGLDEEREMEVEEAIERISEPAEPRRRGRGRREGARGAPAGVR